MKLKLVVCNDAAKGNTLSETQIKAEIDRAAELWKNGENRLSPETKLPANIEKKFRSGAYRTIDAPC